MNSKNNSYFQNPFEDSCETIKKFIESYIKDPISLSDFEYLKMQAHLGVSENKPGCLNCQKFYLELKNKQK